MSDEETTIHAVKTASDGVVKISVERYNELLEKVASQTLEIEQVKSRLHKVLADPPVINRTTVIKTTEMLTQENRLWGNTFISVGAFLFAVGVYRRMAN